MSITEDEARRKVALESLTHYCNEITRLMVYIGRELSECTRIVEQNYRVFNGDNSTTTTQEER